MGIVAAGVGHRHRSPVVRCRRGRGERQARRLGHGQRVHVGAQGHHAAGFRAAQHADHAGMSDTFTHLQAKLLQVRRHQGRGAALAIGQFGVLVDVAPPGDDPCGHGVDAGVDLGQGHGRGAGGTGHQQQGAGKDGLAGHGRALRDGVHRQVR
ncbi:MAG: hypothetical protein IPH86_10410 [bacterium]|nr:hypothetical protein [bacterium]